MCDSGFRSWSDVLKFFIYFISGFWEVCSNVQRKIDGHTVLVGERRLSVTYVQKKSGKELREKRRVSSVVGRRERLVRQEPAKVKEEG